MTRAETVKSLLQRSIFCYRRLGEFDFEGSRKNILIASAIFRAASSLRRIPCGLGIGGGGLKGCRYCGRSLPNELNEPFAFRYCGPDRLRFQSSFIFLGHL